MPPRRAVIVTPGPSPAWPSLPSTAPEITCGRGGAGGGVTPTVTTPLVRRGQGTSDQHSEGEGGQEVVMGEEMSPADAGLGWAGLGPVALQCPGACCCLPAAPQLRLKSIENISKQLPAARPSPSLLPWKTERFSRECESNVALPLGGFCDVCYAVGIIEKFPCCCIV